jgi:ABC-type multidrug transport system ATPase subunit
MTAIMGASGCGKTSLLNVLAGRLGVSKGSKLSGTVRVNGRELLRSDFGKFGAFVQQDDILIETMTPLESFVFCARLRTNYNDN